jgi:hypothetical protein
VRGSSTLMIMDYRTRSWYVWSFCLLRRIWTCQFSCCFQCVGGPTIAQFGRRLEMMKLLSKFQFCIEGMTYKSP